MSSPGSGLVGRVIGEVTKDRLEIFPAADEILIDEIISAGLYRKISPALAVLLPNSTVGVMGVHAEHTRVVCGKLLSAGILSQFC